MARGKKKKATTDKTLKLSTKEKKAKKRSKLGGSDAAKKIETCLSGLESCFPDPDGDGWAKSGSTLIYYTEAQEARRAELLKQTRKLLTDFMRLGNSITTYS